MNSQVDEEAMKILEAVDMLKDDDRKSMDEQNAAEPFKRRYS